MRKILLVTFFILNLIALTTYAADAPVGLWKTIDDVTGKAKSILQIWEAPDHTLQGKLVKIFPDPGHDEHEICVACKGENHNKPFVGLTIMWGFKFDKDQWNNGRILDPRSGKVYHCNLKTLGDDKLLVHGYIGIPLFGRTQTWIRQTKI